MTTKKWTVLAWIFAAFAVADHFYLLSHHLSLHFSTGETSSVCNISTKLSCDAAALSTFSEFMGIPIAAFGIASHVILLLILTLWLSQLARRPEVVLGSAFVLSGGIFGASIVMLGLSIFVVKAYCPFCAVAYALSALQFFAIWKSRQESALPISELVSEWGYSHRWILALWISIPLGGWLVFGLMTAGSPNIKIVSLQAIEDWKAAPLNQFKLEEGMSMHDGKLPLDSSDLVLVEFADFLCPHCKRASAPLKSFAEFNPKVKLVFKPFPLDRKCNDAVSSERDGLRCELAYAAVCSEQIFGVGMKYSEEIFELQHLWSLENLEENLKKISESLKVDHAQIQECKGKPETRLKVMAMAAEGANAKIEGTPTIFANGRRLPSGQLIPVLKLALEEAKK